jgi:predicted alpha-1,2-mannosidase
MLFTKRTSLMGRPIIFSASLLILTTIAFGQNNPAGYVNPLIGTTGGGNTFPGAVRPWGMVSVSPHTSLGNPAGYNAGMSSVYGFGHVHMSGVGCTDLGDITLMPTTGALAINEDNYKSDFSGEVAAPGYYKSNLTTYGITAEMSATVRTGISKYTFPARSGDANILIDVSRALTPSTAGYVKVTSDSTIEGWNKSGGFCGSTNKHVVYFSAVFSKASKSFHTWNGTLITTDNSQTGTDIGAALSFKTTAGKAIYVKVGISYVSIANAALNLKAEQSGFDFNKVKADAQNDWNSQLSKIQTSGGSTTNDTIFYTALYHVLMHPNINSDVNGQYRSEGTQAIETAVGYNHYTIYSLWDTYRNLHSLLTLVYPDRQLDMVKTMMAMYRENGWLPKWELASSDTRTMVGDPACIVIADTYIKGIKNFDISTAYQAMKKGATQYSENPLRPGLDQYISKGYIPQDNRGMGWAWGSAATSLEYYFADWSIAQVAQSLGNTADYNLFLNRSKGYKNLYDSTSGFLRPRNDDGSWISPFDIYTNEGSESWSGSGGPGYVEGNAWQYNMFVPHDIAGLRDLMGGDKAFLDRLQLIFDLNQFEIGNEPDINYPYLFDYFPGHSWRTQSLVRKYMGNYNTGSSGIPGNDDCGVMSAWYVFGAMGFYPSRPASNEYLITTPIFKKITIQLDPIFYPSSAGKKLVIQTTGNPPADTYINSLNINGAEYTGQFITHQNLIQGDSITYNLSSVKSGANADPTVAITSPLTNSSYAGSITIKAAAKDFDGSVAKVEFFMDHVKIGESLTVPYEFKYNVTSNQTVSFTAKATDNTGAVTTSFPVVVKLHRNKQH